MPADSTPIVGKVLAPPVALDPNAARAQVDDAGVTRSGAIWAIRGHALAVSSDHGASWRSGTVPIPPAGTIGPTTFVLDAEHAWSLTAPAGDGDHGQGPSFDHVRLIVNRTSDGGRTWQQAMVPGDYPDTSRSLFFLDPHQGFLVVSGGRTNQGSSTLLRTSDGGASWTIVRTVPASETATETGAFASLGSQVVATDLDTIWSAAQGEAGPVNHPILDVSRDGGLTWSRVALPGIVDRWGGTNNIPSAPATFIDSTAGFFVLSTSDVTGNPETLVFSTDDGGATWLRAAMLPAPLVAPIDFVDRERWIAVEQGSSGLPWTLEETTDAGRTWRALAPTGLLGDGLQWVAMSDPEHGVGTALVEGNPAATILMLTSDGGASWASASNLPDAFVEEPAPSLPTPGPTGTPIVSASPSGTGCRIETVVLGRLPAMSSDPSAVWFNVIEFESSAAAKIAFDVPVIPWPGEPGAGQPTTVYPLVPGPTHKLTFRPASDAVTKVEFHLVGACTGAGTVDLTGSNVSP